MTRLSKDPFQSLALPEVIEEYLEHGDTVCIRFNRWGTILAAGCQDGKVVLWDNDTRGVAKILQGHEKAVTGLSWSRDGRKLVSSGEDSLVILWDVARGTQEATVKLGDVATSVSVVPTKPHICIANLRCGVPDIVDLHAKTTKQLPLLQLGEDGGKAVACVDVSGTRAFIAQIKGWLFAVNLTTLLVEDAVKIPQSARVLSMQLNRKGSMLLLNCQDRTIRMFAVRGEAAVNGHDIAEVSAKVLSGPQFKAGSALYAGDAGLLSFQHEYANAIERTAWHATCISNDSEHILAANADRTRHDLHIWQSTFPKFECMLEGPGDGVRDVAWHPIRSMVYSVSGTGKIYIWAPVYQESWSAFAPDFKELDENTEYVEKETEFDLNEDAVADTGHVGDDDSDVDIETQSVVFAYFSSDDDDVPALHHLDVEIVEASKEVLDGVNGDDGNEDSGEEDAAAAPAEAEDADIDVDEDEM